MPDGRAAAVCLLLAGAIAGCEATAGPTVPKLLVPTEGEATGSVWAAGTASDPLRPQFRWTAVAGAADYQIQIDDSCAIGAPCAFPAPVVDTRVTGTSFAPSKNLPVSTTPPVGRRYFWRVRACGDAGTCQAWSRTRQVDVGRQRQDFNGDGYADLAVVATSWEGSSLFVYFGGSSLPTAPAWIARSDDQTFSFQRVLWMGDANGDGFADLTVVVDRETGDTIRLYLGGSPPAPDPTLETASASATANSLGATLAGDMNGDGFADLFQGYGGPSANAYQVSFGPDLVAESTEAVAVTRRVGAACDFDSDGFTDLLETGAGILFGGPQGPLEGRAPQALSTPPGADVMACPWNLDGRGEFSLLLESDPGGTRALALQSSAAAGGPSAGCDGPLPALPPAGLPSFARMGGAAGVGDVDGDGYADLLVGDPANNRAALFFGGCPATDVAVLPGTSELGGTPNAGAQVAAAGDLDGDGFPDFAVANVFSGFDDSCTGEVYVYRGGSRPTGTPAIVLTDPDHAAPTPGSCAEDGFGAWLD